MSVKSYSSSEIYFHSLLRTGFYLLPWRIFRWSVFFLHVNEVDSAKVNANVEY